MTVTADKAAPYAPTTAVMDLVERHRAKGLPSPVTADVLSRAGISDSLNSRTLYTLQSLDLIDDAGLPTPTFEAIRTAPEAEYKQRLVEWLNGAYADALKYVDPAVADDVAVRDAFRKYTPIAQQARMVSLFRGLYSAAGIGAERPAQQPRQQARAPASRTRMISKSGSGGRTTSHVKPSSSQTINGLPQPIAGLLSRLPEEGSGWTQEKRDKFMATFGTVVDFCFPIVENDEDEGADEGAEIE